MTSRFALSTCAVLLFTACTSGPQREYIPPEGDYADECLSDCSQARTTCRARAQDLYRICRNELEYRERQYEMCVARGGNFCIKPERCVPPQTDVCDRQYDGCFQACGGVIREAERS